MSNLFNYLSISLVQPIKTEIELLLNTYFCEPGYYESCEGGVLLRTMIFSSLLFLFMGLLSIPIKAFILSLKMSKMEERMKKLTEELESIQGGMVWKGVAMVAWCTANVATGGLATLAKIPYKMRQKMIIRKKTDELNFIKLQYAELYYQNENKIAVNKTFLMSETDMRKKKTELVKTMKELANKLEDARDVEKMIEAVSQSILLVEYETVQEKLMMPILEILGVDNLIGFLAEAILF